MKILTASAHFAADQGRPRRGQAARCEARRLDGGIGAQGFQPVAQLDDRRRVPLAASRARYLASVCSAAALCTDKPASWAMTGRIRSARAAASLAPVPSAPAPFVVTELGADVDPFVLHLLSVAQPPRQQEKGSHPGSPGGPHEPTSPVKLSALTLSEGLSRRPRADETMFGQSSRIYDVAALGSGKPRNGITLGLESKPRGLETDQWGPVKCDLAARTRPQGGSSTSPAPMPCRGPRSQRCVVRLGGACARARLTRRKAARNALLLGADPDIGDDLLHRSAMHNTATFTEVETGKGADALEQSTLWGPHCSKKDLPPETRRVERTHRLQAQAKHAPSRCEPRSRATARRAASRGATPDSL
jgi:hypothetical protein